MIASIIQPLSYSIHDVIVSLTMVVVLVSPVTFVYARWHGGLVLPVPFLSALMLTPIVVAIAMMAIGSNIALSLGFVGALSVIRYRTLIQNSRDAAMLLLNCAIGLCCGAGVYMLATVGAVAACLLIPALTIVSRRTAAPNEYTLVVRTNPRAQTAEQVRQILPGSHRLETVAETDGGDSVDHVFRIRFRSSGQAAQMIHRIRSLSGISKCDLISLDSFVA